MGKFGFSWSWRRASGLSAMKGRVSRSIGIPLTRSGRERKVGRMLMGAILPFGSTRRRTQREIVEVEIEPARARYVTSGGCVSTIATLILVTVGVILLMKWIGVG